MNARRKCLVLVEDDPNDVLLFNRAFRRAAPDDLLIALDDAGKAERYLLGQEPFRDRFFYPFPDLLLLDLKMPGKSGFDLLAWIRTRIDLPLVPAVVFTSSSERRDVNRAYALGANSYLVKPAGFESLLDTVANLWTYWSQLNLNPEKVPPCPIPSEFS